MSGNATTTGNKQTSYGSSAAKNRVRPGGDLGNKQYYYKTIMTGDNPGTVEVYRYVPSTPGSKGIPSTTKIGHIPPGGRFNVESKDNGDPIASTDEILHYAETDNINAARRQAAKVATKEWDGKSQPPPNQAIWGDWQPVDKEEREDVTDGGGKPEPSEQEQIDETKKATEVQEPNTSLGEGEFVVYPEGIRRKGTEMFPHYQDCLHLKMVQYKPKKIGEFKGDNMSGQGPRQKNRKGLGSVYLPIPGGIADNNAAQWGGQSMDPVGMAMASTALAAVSKGFQAAGQQASEIMQSATANKGQVRDLISTAIASHASKTSTGQLLTRATGAILNPNMELLFGGPTLRQFNFSWKLAPRSEGEAKKVIQIIRFFKQGMAPIREAPNLFLKSPNTWQLTYMHKDSEHKFLNKMKECALLNVGVQYTPDGNYATFYDGVMNSYQVTLSFQELEPIYSDDYKGLAKDGNSTILGY